MDTHYLAPHQIGSLGGPNGIVLRDWSEPPRARQHRFLRLTTIGLFVLACIWISYQLALHFGGH
jgi:hypothetical protein